MRVEEVIVITARPQASHKRKQAVRMRVMVQCLFRHMKKSNSMALNRSIGFHGDCDEVATS